MAWLASKVSGYLSMSVSMDECIGNSEAGAGPLAGRSVAGHLHPCRQSAGGRHRVLQRLHAARKRANVGVT